MPLTPPSPAGEGPTAPPKEGPNHVFLLEAGGPPHGVGR